MHVLVNIDTSRKAGFRRDLNHEVPTCNQLNEEATLKMQPFISNYRKDRTPSKLNANPGKRGYPHVFYTLTIAGSGDIFKK
jgi:hypothetical protein